MSDRTCSIEGCDRNVYARGWCRKHYAQWRKHGDPLYRYEPQSHRVCSIDGCDNPARARSWCGKHYVRWQKHGDPEAQVREQGRQAEERFWSFVPNRPDDGCWVWTGGLASRGYGMFSVDGRTTLAHRWIWQHLNGPVSDDMVIRHSCDNPPCVNPAHLLVGTYADNTQDAVDRSRFNPIKGEEHSFAKVSEDDVRAIRAAAQRGESRRSIGKRYGLSSSAVDAIVWRRNWKHIM